MVGKKYWNKGMTRELANRWKSDRWLPDSSDEEFAKSAYNELENDPQCTIFHADGSLIPESTFIKHYKLKSALHDNEPTTFFENLKSTPTPRRAGPDNASTPTRVATDVDVTDVGIQRGTDQILSSDSTVVLPWVLGSYDTNLKDGRRVKKVHILVQAPTSWDPAFGDRNYFQLTEKGTKLVIKFSYDEPVFNAQELLINEMFLDKDGKHIYGDVTADGEKHEAVLNFEEAVESDGNLPPKMVITLPFECTEICAIALEDETEGKLKMPKVSVASEMGS